jgi:hypothetical protein
MKNFSYEKDSEPFEQTLIQSLRGAQRRGNLIGKLRLLRFARNDNVGIIQRSRSLAAAKRILLCRIRRVMLAFFAVLMITLGLSFPIAQASQPTEAQVKAAFIYNFAKFTEWPSYLLRDPDKPFVIGVLGDDEFYEALKEVVKEKSVQERPVSVRRITKAEDGRSCHVLYIGDSQEENITYIFDTLKDFHVLTVGDINGFAKKGGMINFVREGKFIRFEINVNAVERSGLKVSAQLLKLAKIVNK